MAVPNFEVPMMHPCTIHQWNVQYDTRFGRGALQRECLYCLMIILKEKERIRERIHQATVAGNRRNSAYWRL